MTAAQPITIKDLDKLYLRIEKMIGTVVGEIVGDALQLVSDRFDKVDQRLDRMDQRFDQIDKRFDRMDQRFDRMEVKLDAASDRVAHHTIDIRALQRKAA